MVLRFLLISLLLASASGAVGQTTTPSAMPHGGRAADGFKQARELLAAGDLDQAFTLTKQGLAQAPHSVVGLNLLGVIYTQQGKYDEAVGQFQHALTIAPNSSETLVNLATTYAAQNKAELAEQTLRTALRVEPANKTANYNLAA